MLQEQTIIFKKLLEKNPVFLEKKFKDWISFFFVEINLIKEV